MGVSAVCIVIIKIQTLSKVHTYSVTKIHREILHAPKWNKFNRNNLNTQAGTKYWLSKHRTHNKHTSNTRQNMQLSLLF